MPQVRLLPNVMSSNEGISASEEAALRDFALNSLRNMPQLRVLPTHISLDQ
jgi:hypothetical protein